MSARAGKLASSVLAVGSKPKKKKRTKPARVEVPLQCSTLNVDAGDNSGWAIWSCGGVLEAFGEVDVYGGEPAQVFDAFLRMPGPHVLIVERPFYVRSGSSTSIGAADKIWREMGKRRGFAKRIVRVYPNSWRAAVLPRGTVGGKRDQVRAVELSYAQGVAHYYLGISAATTVGPDAAAAILIGEWAMQAGEVLAVLPKARPTKQLQLEGVPTSKRPKKARAA